MTDVSKEETKVDDMKSVREKLKECKPVWLEKNAKGQDALGVNTVTQILDYATEGVTTWDFVPDKEWREEVMKFNKGSQEWIFDGYVYHVRGILTIHGIGSRSQYGSKVAIGGKDNQNSSYKSAASDCLKKCASLFGVGSSIYSKIKIETEEESYQQPQYQQATQPQQFTLPNGDIQQGEYIWSQNQWIHQSQYNPNQGGQYPRQLSQQEQKTQWYYDTMQQYDPNGYQEMRHHAGPSPLEQQQYQQQQEANVMHQAAQAADQAVATNQVDFPFENVPTPVTQLQAEPQSFQAEPQTQVQEQDFQAVQPVGAPVVDEQSEVKEEPKQEVNPLAHIQANNPWDTPENKNELELFHQHKERLNIQKDADLLPHVREYFKDGNATIANVTPEVLKGFNSYLLNIQA